MYRFRSNGDIKSQGEIRKMFKNVSFPRVWTQSVIDSIGIDPVLAAPKPQPSSGLKVVVLDGAIQDSLGNWVQNWTERDMFQDIPEGLTKEEQEANYLQTLKDNLIPQINTIRYSKIYQESIPYTFPGDTEPDGIQMRDETDRQNIQDFVIDAMSRDSSDVMYFMPVSNTLKSLTPQEAITMGLTLKARGDSLIGFSWMLKEQIQSIETVDELLALDINSGWPL